MVLINKEKRYYIQFWTFYLSIILIFFSNTASSQITDSLRTKNNLSHVQADSLTIKKESELFRHQLNAEYRPALFIRSKSPYNTENRPELNTGFTQSEHLKYSFSLPENSLGNKIFPNTQQGIGIAIFDFGSSKELGTPLAMYLFQRSEIAKISNHLSLDYEWNFGLSAGWKHYDRENNPKNTIVGSNMNAYINLGTSLRWQLTKRISLNTGIDFTHFSNGNTNYPNAGINLSGVKLGLIYDVSRNLLNTEKTETLVKPVFTRHFSYDMVVFGSWRRKGVDFFGKQVPSPEKYPVLGAYFAPMYNWGYRFRTGVSLDLIYDGSANVYTEDYIVGTDQEFLKPPLRQQIALGFSVRADYVMPIFTIGVGIGANVLHKGGDFNGTYQSFSIKIKTTKNSFIHIGYNLKDFHRPNYLMLGVGYRFNNKVPSLLNK